MDGGPSMRRHLCSSVPSALGLPVAKGGCPPSAPGRQRSHCTVRGRAAAGREKPELHRLIRPVPARLLPRPLPFPSRPTGMLEPRGRGGAAGGGSEDRGVRSLPAGLRDPRLAPPAVPAWENHDLAAAAGVGPRSATGAKGSVGCAWPGCGGWRGRGGRCEPCRHRGRIPPGARPLEGAPGPGSAHYSPVSQCGQGRVASDWTWGPSPEMLEGLEEIIFSSCPSSAQARAVTFFLVRSALLSTSHPSFAMETTGTCWGKVKVKEGMGVLLNAECR